MLLDLFSLIVGGMIGAFVGYTTCAMMVMAKDSDRRMEDK